MTEPVIGFVGAGRLGEPAVERLLADGRNVRLYARREDVRDRLRDKGAIVAVTVQDAARAADVLILFLFSDEQLSEVALETIGVMRRGSVLVVHTTASMSTLTALADAAAPRGVSVVDAPVSGTAPDVRAGGLTVLTGGEPDAVERCAPVLRAYADPVLPVGPLGSAMKVKLLNNILFAAQMQLAAEAAALAERLGVEPAVAYPAVQECSGASKAIDYVIRSGKDVAEFAVGIEPYLRKDVQSCETTARELGESLGLLGDVARRGPLDIA